MAQYSWSLNPDDNFSVPEYSVEDCVREAKAAYELKKGDVIYVGECVPVDISPNLSDVLEQVEEDVYEQIGEISDSWDISSMQRGAVNRRSVYEKYEKKLKTLVKDYIKEIGENPNFEKVINIREVKIEQ